MSQPSTLRFAAHESTVRRVAAGLALALSLGLMAGLDHVADRQYDEAWLAQSDNAPTQVVVITAKRPAA
ncbi:hypothetical protein AACH06_14945 [Ideonella sp. DXS29W]|uniref:Uncharacterized protein n=1 Tax=Ideonella lacteola TaxID=2984193 RepID=A0ABU9BQ84_9BURK